MNTFLNNIDITFKKLSWNNMRVVTFCILFFLFSSLLSQQVGTQFWNMLVVSHKTGRTGYWIEEQLRYKGFYDTLNVAYTDLGINYDLNRTFNIGCSYRPWWVRREGELILDNKFLIDFKVNKNIQKFYSVFRTRYQTNMRFTEATPIERVSRNQWDIIYKTKKHEPYIQAEIFFPLEYFRQNSISVFRAACGEDFRITPKITLRLQFMFVRQYKGSQYSDFVSYATGMLFKI